MIAASTSAVIYNDKRRRKMVTPEGISLPITVGSRGSRVGAYMLDIMIYFFAQVVFWILMAVLFSTTFEDTLSGTEDGVTGAAEFIVILYTLVSFVGWYAYFFAFELSPRGATPGKRIVGLRVAARDGGRLTAEAIIARNLIRDIEALYPIVFLFVVLAGEGGNMGWAAAIWFCVFCAFPFFNKDALRAGDMIAGTWVVEAPRLKLADTMSTQGAAHGTSGVTGAKYQFGDEELGIYGEHELQTLERVLRDDKYESLVAVHGTICHKIGWNPGAGDERAFLEAFYAQLRAKLEGDMRFGKRKADKYS